MTQIKHTPGPWAYERGDYVHTGSHVITARHAGMTNRSPLAVVSGIVDGADDGAALADAHLIAAAPYLLALARHIHEVGSAVSPEDVEALRRVVRGFASAAEGAIAKAEG